MDVEERIAGARKVLELVIATLKGHADAFPSEERTNPNLRANLAKTLWALSETVEKLKEIVIT